MKDARTIAREIRVRIVDLERIADLLDPPEPTETLLSATVDIEPTVDALIETLEADTERFYAPHGYKADGTPRRRRPMSAEARARAWETRRKNAQAAKGRAAKPKPLRLKVLSQATPTPAKLKDRDVAYTTEGAA